MSSPQAINLRRESAKSRSPVERRASAGKPARQPVIKIFTVYQSEVNRDRALRMQEELTRRLGRSFAFSNSWWSLKGFQDSASRKLAARMIAGADIICFSLLSGGEIPAQVAAVLEKGLLGRKAPRTCLLALVETGGNGAPRLSQSEVYLSQLSSAAGVDCICYSDNIPLARNGRSAQRQNDSQPWGRSSSRAASSSFFLSSLRRHENAAAQGNLQSSRSA